MDPVQRDPRRTNAGCLLWMVLLATAYAIGSWAGWFYGLIFMVAALWTAIIMVRK